ncbi:MULTISPECIES: universal stress protein [Bradyrhizobium]|uniref:universal stress protein n=1 Tax=Bradyrhizobium TaxID=374 RepID=UPI0019570E74|nr:universal stress protein [Bradyrhizobium canariense]MBM7486051.1 nucleotide-binding universal stress UspA family protein [Bradyrhizobium canariense]UFW72920.1 universal stress protein [Bradyrhizobium canariense]
MYKRILLAFDGSPDGRDALVHAQNVAAACGSTVHLVSIVDSPEPMLTVEGGASFFVDQGVETRALLDEAVRQLAGTGCAATGKLNYGKPAEQIILAAVEMGADLIIVGRRDQGALASYLNGPADGSTLPQLPCSVLVVAKSESTQAA